MALSTDDQIEFAVHDDAAALKRLFTLPVSARLDALAAMRGVSSFDTAGMPGQADSAPHRFNLKRHLIKAATVAALLFALYYVNWIYGWVTPDDLDFYHRR